MFIDFRRGANLLNLAQVEDCDPVTHREGFFLIVRHKNKRNSHPSLDRLQFHLHLLAQFEIQCAQRLIEEKHLWMVDQGAAESDTLTLSAG